jgi:CRP/FNR family transcriptional regulator, cyclic AMP receptor protein
LSLVDSMKTHQPLVDIDSVVSILSRISIWGGLTDEQQAEIYARLEVFTFGKGEYVFRQGDMPSHIFVVKSGKIEIVASGKDVTFRKEVVETGGCFGVIALMAVQSYGAAAVAVEDTELMVLSTQALLDLYHEDVHLFALLMMNIAREVARKLTAADEVLLECVHELKGE